VQLACGTQHLALRLSPSSPHTPVTVASLRLHAYFHMATITALGLGAVVAGLAGRHFMKRGAKAAGDQWVKGGFKGKMDRGEAIAILGLK
jgi:hypothetical protein